MAKRSFLIALCLLGCSGVEEADPAPPCEPECQDSVALRALRETMKLVYNVTLQGNPVGPQDESTPCPLGGSARVFGTASSNPIHGATEVDLTYELSECRYLSIDEEPKENYQMTISGTLTQVGTLAVQPTASTGLVMQSDSVTLSGSVYDPPIAYTATDCEVALGQDGNLLSGTICGRQMGTDL